MSFLRFQLYIMALITGMLAFTVFYADILKPWLPVWAIVALFTLPVALVLFFQYGECSDRVLVIAHLTAATMFLLLAAGLEICIHYGYRPPGTLLYRFAGHFSWSFAWAAIFWRAMARARLKKTADAENRLD